ncbi:MAG: type IV pilus twitching motility protein PilT [Armatimonadetes bacterium]|nr:type IV pilus twitching motility protein PilT [Armatimonadota bacterium]
MVDLDELLEVLVREGGSDLHLRVGEPPLYRVHGDLQRTDSPPLTKDTVARLVFGMMTDEQRVLVERRAEVDLGYEIPGLARFRVNVYWERGWVSAALRLIPLHVRTIDELGLPPIIKKLAQLQRGLVLVTGPTGSGKSTTLAAMVDWINEHRRGHVVTIEDPVEFSHADKLSSISQRELGTDTHSFAAALRHVMRQNPDVILVGEMRDLATIQLTVTAAELGHLVLSTVHTTDAAQTVDRIVDVFEPQRQQQIRTQLALTLQAVLSQTLVPRADRPGRVAAFEIMLATPAIRNVIRDRRTHQLYGMIETGSEEGMQLMDMHLLELCRRGLVSYEQALARSMNPRDFQARASGLVGRPAEVMDGIARRRGER